jgi:hypothetical protein
MSAAVSAKVPIWVEWYLLGRLGREQLAGVVAVVLRPHTAADHERRAARLLLVADLLQEPDRLAIDTIELLAVVTELTGPARAGSPGRTLEHEAHPPLARQGDVGRVIATQLLGAPVVLEQVEGGERGQVEALVEDEHGLDPTVREEEDVPELGQLVAVRHGLPS